MRRHSVHIGNTRYEDEAIPDIRHCVADAEMLAACFREVAGLDEVEMVADARRAECRMPRCASVVGKGVETEENARLAGGMKQKETTR